MKVMLVTVGLEVGGAEQLIVDLSSGLVAAGDSVVVVSMLPAGALGSSVVATGAAVVELGFRRGRPSARGLRTYTGLLRKERPDVVHASMFHANMLARLGRLLVPTPCVLSSAHNVNEAGDDQRRRWTAELRGLGYRLTDNLSELTSQVSLVGAQRYVENSLVSADRMAFVPNGIDTSRFALDGERRAAVRASLGIEPAERMLLTVGALTDQKNHRLLIEAFEMVSDHMYGLRLVIAGDGPHAEALAHQTAKSRHSSKISLLGVRNDVADLMNGADLFVLPSSFEGMPLVVLEAMASGLPIVATAVGAIPDIVGQSDFAWLSEADSKSAFASALRDACELEPHQWRSRGSKAFERAQTSFGIQNYVDRWRQLYLLLSQNSAQRRASPAGELAKEIWSSI